LPEHRFTPEFLLTAACCEWPSSAARNERLRGLAGSADWDLVLKLGRRHRVEGLMHRALSEAAIEVPTHISQALEQDAAAIGTQSLLQSAESARLQRLLGERGIDCLFVKGVPLAKLAYGALGIKQSWDIDLLVAPEHTGAVMSLLRELGYERDYPGDEVPDERLLEWAAISKETLWIHRQSGMVVELHTALVDNPWLLPTVAVRPDVQRVQIGPGIELATLGTDQLFAYLCVHGGAHAWARLKWLADVGALATKLGPDELERVYRVSVELGAGRSSAQALLLCTRLLGLPLPPPLSAELGGDRVNRWLEHLALQAMSRHGATELDDTVFGTVAINLSHFLLGHGWRYKYREIVRKCVNPEDRFAMPLPRRLHFLYPALAVPRWIWRRYKLSRS
jgi:hypothetical protein